MKCHHCQAAEATESNETFCQSCKDSSDSWDPTDAELLDRLGRAEVRAWRKAAWEARDLETVDLLDASGLTGQSRWETIAERAEREAVSTATIRRAIERGLTHKRDGRKLLVDRTEPLPPTQPTGPQHTYEVRQPGHTAWWTGTTVTRARAQLRRALQAGLVGARIIKDGEWMD
jgi:hypothetical protein